MEWHKRAEMKWDAYAENWSSNAQQMWENGSRKEIIPFFVKHVPKQGSVCDLGCGDGYGTMKLHSEGYDVVGLDLSNEMVEMAKKRTNYTVDFIQGDISTLPFASEEIEAVMVINAIEWTENPFSTLEEIRRVVKKGGHACFGILGPTAAPRVANSYHRLYGEKIVMNSMLPWEFERLALENGWSLVDELWVEKKEAKREQLMHLPKELQQSLSFMWLFMLKKID
ncbi:MAG: class I SAM-dependent methyltransferase [Bacillus sp. (in: firmicutes)]